MGHLPLAIVLTAIASVVVLALHYRTEGWGAVRREAWKLLLFVPAMIAGMMFLGTFLETDGRGYRAVVTVVAVAIAVVAVGREYRNRRAR